MTGADRPVGPPETPDASTEEALAAAILDAEATAPERARADDPAVAAALAAQRRVAQALAAAPPVDDAGRERAVAAALAAWDADEQRAGGANVDDLARRRAQRANRLLPALGAAAAVVVALVLGGLALSGGDDGDQTASGDAFEATTDEGAGGAGSGVAGGTGSDAAGEGATSLAAEVAFGSFADLDALLAEVGRTAAQARGALGDLESLEEAAGAPPSATAGVAESQTSAGDLGTGGAPVADSTCVPPALPEGTYITGGAAALDGRPVAVTVVDGPDGIVVQVVEVSTCEVVYEGPPT